MSDDGVDAGLSQVPIKQNRHHICVEEQSIHPTATTLYGWILLTKLPNHGIEAIHFGWVSIINGREVLDRWLEPWNGHFRVGQISPIHNLGHNSSVPDRLLSCLRAADRSKPAVPGLRVRLASLGLPQGIVKG